MNSIALNRAYVIDKNVPIPDSAAGRPVKYPFSDMSVGDSFSVARTEVLKVRAAASYYSARHGQASKFTIRQDGDAFRCWRFA